MSIDDLISAKVFTKEFKRILEQLRVCEEWRDRFMAEFQTGWKPRMAFEKLREETHKLLLMFSDVFKTYCKDENVYNKLNTDLTNFLNFMWNRELGRDLTYMDIRQGEILTALDQISSMLNYIKVVMENTLEDIREVMPHKFVKHALRNVGIFPQFKMLKSVKVEEEI